MSFKYCSIFFLYHNYTFLLVSYPYSYTEDATYKGQKAIKIWDTLL